MVTAGNTGNPGLTPGLSGRPYFILNVLLAGVILFIMGYSLFYSPDEERYPIPCIHEKLTGEPCPSCGLSHAFSLIVRGRISEAMEWNSYSMRLFVFFALQLLMRTALAIAALKAGGRLRIITITDAAVSAVMTLAAFYPFLRLLRITLF